MAESAISMSAKEGKAPLVFCSNSSSPKVFCSMTRQRLFSQLRTKKLQSIHFLTDHLDAIARCNHVVGVLVSERLSADTSYAYKKPSSSAKRFSSLVAGNISLQSDARADVQID
jgi:hypothetical protein